MKKQVVVSSEDSATKKTSGKMKTNRKKKFAVKKVETKPPVNLLLAYTYFLNEQHTCYTTCGFDPDTFEGKMLLYKDFKYISLDQTDWIVILETLYGNKENTEDFKDTQSCYELSKTGKDGEKTLTLTSGPKSIVLNQAELVYLQEMSLFLISVLKWCATITPEIKQYFNMYVKKCIANNTYSLLSTDYFLPLKINNYSCNYSRLFNEIPVLCAIKIITECYYQFFSTM